MQAKVEAREALRQLVAALNGLAGICILKGEVRQLPEQSIWPNMKFQIAGLVFLAIKEHC